MAQICGGEHGPVVLNFNTHQFVCITFSVSLVDNMFQFQLYSHLNTVVKTGISYVLFSDLRHRLSLSPFLTPLAFT